MIELHHASKMYGLVCGVNDLHLNIPMGSYGLIGPNGSGKTTLINLLTGNLRPSLGRVRVFDCSPAGNPQVLRRIGLCPATDLLIPNVTAFQWVEHLARLYGFSQSDAARQAETALTLLGMQSSMHQRIGSYSLGMRQRTKLAQAIVHQPDLLILDEPFNGLDPVGRHDLSDFLKGWSAQGKGLLLASHVLHEVEAVTDSFLLIHGGRLLASGKSSEVQSMLSGIPQQIEVSGTGLNWLAKEMLDQPWLSEIRILDQDKKLQVRIDHPLAFFEWLNREMSDPRVVIQTLVSPEGNLTTAFDSLMRAHRGEVPA